MTPKSKRIALAALLVGVLACAAVLGAGAASSSRSADVLKIGTADSPPWILFNPKTKKYYGPSVDLFNAVGKALGMKVEYVDTGYGTAIAGLQAHQFDIIGLPLFNTPERLKVIDFVLWTNSGNCYVALKSNKKVNSLADFNNSDVKMAVQVGASIETDFPKKYPKADVKSVVAQGASPAVQEVLSGRADITDIDAPLAYKYTSVYPKLKAIPSPAACIAHPDFPHDIGMGIRKDSSPEFRATLKKVVKQMHAKLAKELQTYSAPKYIVLPK